MLIVVLGGTRSGKSEIAELLVRRRPPPHWYVATGATDPTDLDFAARIERHRARRPANWATVEAGAALATALADCPDGTCLVDSLGTWVAAHRDFDVDVDELAAALMARRGDTVVVSDEVGLGVHPPTELGRQFRDVLGEVNRRVVALSDRALLTVAGRAVPLPAFDADALDPPLLDDVGPLDHR